MEIVCDVDDVVLDLSTEWYRRYNAEFGDDLTRARVKTWDTHLYVKPECGKQIFKYLQDPDLYDNVQAVEGAVAGIAQLRAWGHQVTFATRCTYGMVDQKARRLEQLGFITPDPHGGLPDELVVISKKNLLRGDLLIDDGAHNIKAWVQDTKRRAIMPAYPHNAGLDLPSMFAPWLSVVQGWAGIMQVIAQE